MVAYIRTDELYNSRPRSQSLSQTASAYNTDDAIHFTSHPATAATVG